MKVKICGITTVDDARCAAAAGADLLGLNFYSDSSRVVSPERAAEIAAAVSANVELVGLFVNADAVQIRRVCNAAEIATVQLHGDEPPEFATNLPEFRIIRAFRYGEQGLRPLLEHLRRARRAGKPPDCVLIDAHHPGIYGGTGKTAPWDRIAREYVGARLPPLLLAGGLTPQNVAEAIRRVHPWGVDTASGVESFPGHKDPEKLRLFISAAQAAAMENDETTITRI